TDFKNDIAGKWESMTPAERFEAVKKLQEKQFDAVGVPKPTITQSKDAAAGWDDPVNLYGEANDSAYSMTYNGNLFDKDTLSEHDQKELAKTMMHEGRHIEQYYRIAQYRAAQGDSANDITSKDTPTHDPAGIPQNIADEAFKNPLPAKAA